MLSYEEEIGKSLYYILQNFIKTHKITDATQLIEDSDITDDLPNLVDALCNVVEFYDEQDEEEDLIEE